MPITRRRALAALGVLGTMPAWAQEASDVHVGFAGTHIHFASVPAGRELLMAEDEWLRATSEFQRRAIMNAGGPASLDVFRRWSADAVQAWSPGAQAQWRQVLDALAPAFAALNIPLPADVWLVSTSGRDMASTPYTRGNIVVLPEAVRLTGHRAAMLMAHELWHVASRHAPLLATRLYAELGFEPIAPLEFPLAWAPIRIANPDAPGNRHAMRATIEGRTGLFTPVLVAARTSLQPGESFFDVMQVRLLEVTSDAAAGVSHAVLQEGQPVWYPLNVAHDYVRQLGGNTDYVLHVEEALADNIALLVTGAAVRNPALLARIRAVLTGSSRT